MTIGKPRSHTATSAHSREACLILSSSLRRRVVLERDTGVSKGYGFCAYYDLANAESAVRNLSGRDLNGRPMRLGFAEDYAFRNSDQQGSQGMRRKAKVSSWGLSCSSPCHRNWQKLQPFLTGTGGAAAQGVVQQPPFQQQQLPTHPQVGRVQSFATFHATLLLCI